MKLKITSLALLGLFIYSCAPKVAPTPPPPPAPAKTPDVAVAASNDLAEGKGLYENNCAKCHSLYKPSDYTAEEWNPILERMKKKAKIDDATTAKIYAYLTAK